jgi:predicted dehydrogenase
MNSKVKLAVLGAGLIGKRHIHHVLAEPLAELSAIVDPSDAGKAMATELGVRWSASLQGLLDVGKPDGLIVATPNQVHVQNGLEAVAAGLPALIEKPIADDVDSGTRLVEAAEAAGVPLLTGHHRRHNPMIRKAKAILDEGRLGRVLTAHAMFWVFKPDDYFDVGWRRAAGGGPVFLNLIHDVDNLRYLLGDVVSVQARESNAVRRHPVEETSVVLLEFASGVLATCSVSDAVVGPWSWEQTTGENAAFPREDQFCYLIGGTHGSLSIPALELWRNPGKRSWLEPFDKSREGFEAHDPLAQQIRNFCRVIRGEEQPVVSGREGLETLKVILAVKQAAASGKLVKV